MGECSLNYVVGIGWEDCKRMIGCPNQCSDRGGVCVREREREIEGKEIVVLVFARQEGERDLRSSSVDFLFDWSCSSAVLFLRTTEYRTYLDLAF